MIWYWYGISGFLVRKIYRHLIWGKVWVRPIWSESRYSIFGTEPDSSIFTYKYSLQKNHQHHASFGYKSFQAIWFYQIIHCTHCFFSSRERIWYMEEKVTVFWLFPERICMYGIIKVNLVTYFFTISLIEEIIWKNKATFFLDFFWPFSVSPNGPPSLERRGSMRSKLRRARRARWNTTPKIKRPKGQKLFEIRGPRHWHHLMSSGPCRHCPWGTIGQLLRNKRNCHHWPFERGAWLRYG